MYLRNFYKIWILKSIVYFKFELIKIQFIKLYLANIKG